MTHSHASVSDGNTDSHSSLSFPLHNHESDIIREHQLPLMISDIKLLYNPNILADKIS